MTIEQLKQLLRDNVAKLARVADAEEDGTYEQGSMWEAFDTGNSFGRYNLSKELLEKLEQ